MAASNNGKAVFRFLPRQHTLTVRIDSPEPWNVQATLASQDIDSLRCDSSGCGDLSPEGIQTDVTRVTYTLKNILIAGQCFEELRARQGQLSPPNGLQLTLMPTRIGGENAAFNQSRIRSDTLVMQNLGYFQLQANPGVWQLNLASGRASELYTVEGGDIHRTGGVVIPVRSFASTLTRLMVSKKPGKESVSLLTDSDDDESDDAEGETGLGSVWDSVSSFFGGDEKKHSKKDGAKKAVKTLSPVAGANDEDNKIHVFSLATGHMYERLLRIMMLSVTKRTSVPVKVNYPMLFIYDCSRFHSISSICVVLVIRKFSVSNFQTNRISDGGNLWL